MGRIRSSRSEEAATASAAVAAALCAIDPVIEGVLANWGLWASARTGVRKQASATFRMAGRGTRGGVVAVASTINVDEAWRAEKTVCNPEFSPRFRAILTSHYVYRETVPKTCKALGIHWAAYDHELWRAALFFWTRYQRVPA